MTWIQRAPEKRGKMFLTINSNISDDVVFHSHYSPYKILNILFLSIKKGEVISYYWKQLNFQLMYVRSYVRKSHNIWCILILVHGDQHKCCPSFNHRLTIDF